MISKYCSLQLKDCLNQHHCVRRIQYCVRIHPERSVSQCEAVPFGTVQINSHLHLKTCTVKWAGALETEKITEILLCPDNSETHSITKR